MKINRISMKANESQRKMNKAKEISIICINRRIIMWKYQKSWKKIIININISIINRNIIMKIRI